MIFILKRKKTIWGVFEEGLCSRFHPRIDKTTETVPETVGLLAGVVVTTVVLLLSMLKQRTVVGLATPVTARFHSKEPERKKKN